MIVTADVPKISRVAGLGIVTLAKYSQCPIVPVAMATSRLIRLSNWDRTAFSLPFGRMGLARGGEIRVARDADDAALEAARLEVQNTLNAVTDRAYEIARNGRARGRAAARKHAAASALRRGPNCCTKSRVDQSASRARQTASQPFQA